MTASLEPARRHPEADKIWGFVGGHWARFSPFAYAPRALAAYPRGQAFIIRGGIAAWIPSLRR